MVGNGNSKSPVRRRLVSCGVVALLFVACALSLAFIAPTETTMGDAQRVLYVHVPVAWIGILAFLLLGATSLLYLKTRRLAWDHWSTAATEIGWGACGLTLATGSLWARSAWGTAWTWDPRLTASFVLWLIYGGCLIVRRSIVEDHRRARIASVLACIGAADLPMVVMATRWFRGIHPVAPEMEPAMRFVLLVHIAAFTGLCVVLLDHRRKQIAMESDMERSMLHRRFTENGSSAARSLGGSALACYPKE